LVEVELLLHAVVQARPHHEEQEVGLFAPVVSLGGHAVSDNRRLANDDRFRCGHATEPKARAPDPSAATGCWAANCRGTSSLLSSDARCVGARHCDQAESKLARNESADIRVGGLEYLQPRWSLAHISGYQNWSATWRNGDGDVIDGAARTASGLIADDPSPR
jgi:hypothetical protein